MISVDIDFAALDAKIESIRKIKTRLAGAAFATGVQHARSMTPQDTGFLAASFQLELDGVPVTYDPPEGDKVAADEDRPWRFGTKEPRRPVWVGDEPFGTPYESGGEMFDVDDVSEILSAFTGRNRNMPSSVVLRNTASYGELLNDLPHFQNRESDNEHVGWFEYARSAYIRGVKGRIAQEGG